MLVPLIGGAYEAESVIAAAQRCVNLFMERNPQDSPSPTTHYPTPGLRLLGTSAAGVLVGPVRGLWPAKNGELFAVIGSKVLYVDKYWVLTTLGDIGYARTPVGMIDNGIDLIISDGTIRSSTNPAGWIVNLATHSFAAYVDANFLGSTQLDMLDTFLIFNEPGTSNFYSSLSNDTTIDPTYIAALSGQATLLQAARVMREEIWLIGKEFGEVWADVGGDTFPFARIPGAALMHGCAAPWSVCVSDLSVFWVSKDRQGQGIIMRGRKYECERISTHAIEQIIQKYPTLEDAIGFVYQINGHAMAVFHFPSGDATWVFDDSTGQWHQWASQDKQGELHRHRSNCFAAAYGELVVGDYETGDLYALDLRDYTDNGRPVTRVRSWPGIITGIDRDGKAIPPDGRRITFPRFVAYLEVGEDVVNDDPLNPPWISLRWSDTQGKTWGNALRQSMGELGQYYTQPQWLRLGQARYRVFELSWSIATKTALNGAFISPDVGAS